MDPLTIVGLVSSAVQLTQLACRILSNCFGYYRAVQNSRKDAMALREEVIQLLRLIEEVQVLAEGCDESSPLLQSIKKEFDDIKALLGEVLAYTAPQERRGVRVLRWPSRQDETSRLIAKIKAGKERLFHGQNQYNPQR